MIVNLKKIIAKKKIKFRYNSNLNNNNHNNNNNHHNNNHPNNNNNNFKRVSPFKKYNQKKTKQSKINKLQLNLKYKVVLNNFKK